MEARGIAARMAVRFFLTSICLAALARTLVAASYRTTNFEVHAPTGPLAKQLGDAAEQYRRTLALEWLGHELPQWEERCPIHARIARGAGGETSFYFTRGRVHGWRMEIQGSRERMLDSVLPHEVTHTIFATHFRQPLPRWADEGACTTVEHPSEVARMERELVRFLKTRRGIRFSDMMWMKQYPRDFMPLYAQGHSVAKYLIAQRGKRAFIDFLQDGMGDENWPRAARRHYGFTHLAEMQDQWLDWVRAGRPTDNIGREPKVQLASQSSAPRSQGSQEALVVRGQEPEQDSSGSAGVDTLNAIAREEASSPPSRAAATTLASSSGAPSAVTAALDMDSRVAGHTPITQVLPVSSSSAVEGDSVLFQWRAPDVRGRYVEAGN